MKPDTYLICEDCMAVGVQGQDHIPYLWSSGFAATSEEVEQKADEINAGVRQLGGCLWLSTDEGGIAIDLDQVAGENFDGAQCHCCKTYDRGYRYQCDQPNDEAERKHREEWDRYAVKFQEENT